MKRTFLFGVIITIILTGCASDIGSKRANINNAHIGFSDLTRDDYIILGRVTGESTVSVNALLNKINGDTLEYGYLNELGYAGELSTNLLGGQSVVLVPTNVEDQARRNALYKLILEAKKLDADTVIFVNTMIEQDITKKVKTIHVKASGLAIKIK